MAFSSCFSYTQLSLEMDRGVLIAKSSCSTRKQQQRSNSTLLSMKAQLSNRHIAGKEARLRGGLSFLGGSAITKSNRAKLTHIRKTYRIYSSWWTSPQIASNAFTLGTAVVLPFYTLMLIAPKAELTKKSMESSVPYIGLGVLYAYLLYLSWTPDTIQLMFASKYWLPELPGIAKMFSSEMTLASAWLHLLAVDLFAARQVYKDGLENKIETRHSVSLCLLFCPVGIISHYITKALIESARTKSKIH